MKKKVALVLIMVMFVNMIAWASSTEEEKKKEEETTAALVTIGIVVVVTLLVCGIAALVSEADAPDDGIKLTSMQTDSVPETSFGSFIKLLQHVEFGQKQNGDIFTGLRFKF